METVTLTDNQQSERAEQLHIQLRDEEKIIREMNSVCPFKKVVTLI